MASGLAGRVDDLRHDADDRATANDGVNAKPVVKGVGSLYTLSISLRFGLPFEPNHALVINGLSLHVEAAARFLLVVLNSLFTAAATRYPGARKARRS